MLCYKCIVKWLQSGDHNMRFFHSLLRVRKLERPLSALVKNGLLTTDPIIINACY